MMKYTIGILGLSALMSLGCGESEKTTTYTLAEGENFRRTTSQYLENCADFKPKEDKHPHHVDPEHEERN